VVTTWSNTEIAATVPIGATSGDVIVTVSGLTSNGVPFTVGTADSAEWVLLPNGVPEHAKWLTGQRIGSLLGRDLITSFVTLQPNKTVNDLAIPVLRYGGQFVAVVDPDKTFRGLVDRSAILEDLATKFLKQASSNES
jgi:hypothetical protein